MKMNYIGGRGEFSKDTSYYVEVIGFIPQSDILVSIKTKGNTFRAEKRYPSLNSLLKNWKPDHE